MRERERERERERVFGASGVARSRRCQQRRSRGQKTRDLFRTIRSLINALDSASSLGKAPGARSQHNVIVPLTSRLVAWLHTLCLVSLIPAGVMSDPSRTRSEPNIGTPSAHHCAQRASTDRISLCPLSTALATCRHNPPLAHPFSPFFSPRVICLLISLSSQHTCLPDVSHVRPAKCSDIPFPTRYEKQQ